MGANKARLFVRDYHPEYGFTRGAPEYDTRCSVSQETRIRAADSIVVGTNMGKLALGLDTDMTSPTCELGESGTVEISDGGVLVGRQYIFTVPIAFESIRGNIVQLGRSRYYDVLGLRPAHIVNSELHVTLNHPEFNSGTDGWGYEVPDLGFSGMYDTQPVDHLSERARKNLEETFIHINRM